jgi:hypothetical protein
MILFIQGVIPVEQGRGKAILPANVFCHQSRLVILNMFIVCQALITYLTALGKPKCSLILETTLYMPAFVFLGTPRENSIMPQHI